MSERKYIIAIFASETIKSGAHRRYKELIIGLANRGYRIICYSPENHFGNSIYEFKKIKINDKSLIPITLQLVFQVLLSTERKKLKDNSMILVFGETTALSGIILKKFINSRLLLGVRTSITQDRKLSVHSNGIKISNFYTKNKLLIKLYIKLFSIYERLMYKNADLITVQNEIDKNNVVSIQSNKEVIIIPNNINVHWIEKNELKQINQSKTLNKLGFIGSLIERKGIYPLLSSYKELIDDGLDLELHIAGEGPLKGYIEEFIKENDLKNVYLYGYISNPMEFAKEMDLIIVPSLIDSFPNVIFESWYVGTPVIGSRVGGIEYQLKHDKLLFEPSKKEIVEKIKMCLNDDYYYEVRRISEKRKDDFIFDWVGEYQKLIDRIF